jgi:hypothetical protein
VGMGLTYKSVLLIFTEFSVLQNFTIRILLSILNPFNCLRAKLASSSEQNITNPNPAIILNKIIMYLTKTKFFSTSNCKN